MIQGDQQLGRGRAFGKVIFFGEHAVVYGVSAIAAGISRGVTATASVREQDRLFVNHRELPPEHELYQALLRLRQQCGVGPAELHLDVELPLGAGLGSSASMAVAAARALSDLYGVPLDERQLFVAAQLWEGVFHGNPSGIDVAAARGMGLISFIRGHEPEPLYAAGTLLLAVAQADPPASTKAMVENVARFQKRDAAKFDATLSAIQSLSENARVLFRQRDHAALGKLMDLNQMLLAGWMLSTEGIERACRLAREAGALGAKLTGAGGGGCVLSLCSDEDTRKSVLSAWESAKIPCFSADVGTSH